MKAEQQIMIEKKRLAPAGDRLAAIGLTLSEKAIAAVLDRIIAHNHSATKTTAKDVLAWIGIYFTERNQ